MSSSSAPVTRFPSSHTNAILHSQPTANSTVSLTASRVGNIAVIVQKIMGFLPLDKIEAASRVNKNWKNWISAECFWKNQCDLQGIPPIKRKDSKTGKDHLFYKEAYINLHPIIFGPQQWSKFLIAPHGKIVPLAENTHDKLSEFNSRQKNKFRVLYFPKEVDIVAAEGGLIVTALTVNLLGKLVANPRKGLSSPYIAWKPVIEQLGEIILINSYWAFVSIDLVEGTRNLPIDKQAIIVASSGRGLRPPRLIEAVLLNHSQNVRYNIFPYGTFSTSPYAPETFSNIEEHVVSEPNNTVYELSVGGFSAEGLIIGCPYAPKGTGMAAAYSCESSGMIGLKAATATS